MGRRRPFVPTTERPRIAGVVLNLTRVAREEVTIASHGYRN